VRLCDLVDRNRDAYRTHFRGADAIVHSAFVSAEGLTVDSWSDNSDAKFWAELDNVTMTYNVYRTAIEEGVKRIVVVGSNHAADFYEHLIWSGRMDVVTPDMTPRPHDFYGWAKVACETLGFVFATGEVDGKPLQCIHLRIGAPRDGGDLDDVEPGDIKRLHRGLGAYLSRRDQLQLVVRSIETPAIDDEHGVPFQIFYGISGNTHAFWSIVNARRVIGYEPRDDSQVRFADEIARIARHNDWDEASQEGIP
jgi:hypothetical protein